MAKKTLDDLFPIWNESTTPLGYPSGYSYGSLFKDLYYITQKSTSIISDMTTVWREYNQPVATNGRHEIPSYNKQFYMEKDEDLLANWWGFFSTGYQVTEKDIGKEFTLSSDQEEPTSALETVPVLVRNSWVCVSKLSPSEIKRYHDPDSSQTERSYFTVRTVSDNDHEKVLFNKHDVGKYVYYVSTASYYNPEYHLPLELTRLGDSYLPFYSEYDDDFSQALDLMLFEKCHDAIADDTTLYFLNKQAVTDYGLTDENRHRIALQIWRKNRVKWTQLWDAYNINGNDSNITFDLFSNYKNSKYTNMQSTQDPSGLQTRVQNDETGYNYGSSVNTKGATTSYTGTAKASATGKETEEGFKPSSKSASLTDVLGVYRDYFINWNYFDTLCEDILEEIGLNVYDVRKEIEEDE